jgi:hypothetical protein
MKKIGKIPTYTAAYPEPKKGINWGLIIVVGLVAAYIVYNLYFTISEIAILNSIEDEQRG